MDSVTHNGERAIYVCTPVAGNCCCGNLDKGYPRINWTRWIEAWCRHPISGSIPLVPTKCLGPCDRGNVVAIRCTGSTHWLGDVREGDVFSIFDFALQLSRGIFLPNPAIAPRLFDRRDG